MLHKMSEIRSQQQILNNIETVKYDLKYSKIKFHESPKVFEFLQLENCYF